MDLDEHTQPKFVQLQEYVPYAAQPCFSTYFKNSSSIATRYSHFNPSPRQAKTIDREKSKMASMRGGNSRFRMGHASGLKEECLEKDCQPIDHNTIRYSTPYWQSNQAEFVLGKINRQDAKAAKQDAK